MWGSWGGLEGDLRAWKREFKLSWREAGPPNHHKWIRTSRLSIKNSLSGAGWGETYEVRGAAHAHVVLCSLVGESGVYCSGQRWLARSYRGTSLIRNRLPLGPYSRTMPRALGGASGGLRFLTSEVPLSLGYFGRAEGDGRVRVDHHSLSVDFAGGRILVAPHRHTRMYFGVD